MLLDGAEFKYFNTKQWDDCRSQTWTELHCNDKVAIQHLEK